MKKVFAIILAVIMILSLAACSKEKSQDETTESNEPKGKIYGIYKAGDQSWFIQEGDAARVAAEEAGYQFEYIDAEMDNKRYLKKLNDAVEDETAAGIITCIPDASLSQQVLDLCTAAEIPVVATDDLLQVDGRQATPWVGINAYQIGVLCGEWLGNYAKANLTLGPNIGVLLMTMDTVSSCAPRMEGAYDAFMKVMPEFAQTQIFRADYDGTPEMAEKKAADMFAKHPEITTWLVAGANEEGCMAAAKALRSSGLEENSTVIGMGAYLAKEEFRSNQDSCVKAAAFFSPEAAGQASVDVLIKLIDGEEVPNQTAIDAQIVTPETYIMLMGKFADPDPLPTEEP